MKRSSDTLFTEAKRYIPGGVNSPVRAFGAVGSMPIFIDRAEGSKIYDVEGRAYIDYVASWGPLILGHSHPAVVDAVREAAERGTSYGAPTEREIEMAKIIINAFPGMDRVRMTNSGTEAAMSAIRLARAYTGREMIIKFDGCYHGHADSLLVEAGSGVATLGIPGSPGVPRRLAELTVSLPYNNIEALHGAVDRYADDLACIIVEPVAGNMGVILPRPGFLERLREITRARGILLIFDEVITGFRLAFGGYQTLAGIEPDLTCLGKIIGGGLPIGAFGGRADIMEQLAPSGPVYQAGTLSGNPLAMSAGLAALKTLQQDGSLYDVLDRTTARFCDAIIGLFTRKGIAVRINRTGSMFTLFFTEGEVYDLATARASRRELFAPYFRGMLAGGIMLPPSPFEACFVSAVHTEEDLDRTLASCAKTIEELCDDSEREIHIRQGLVNGKCGRSS